MDEGKQPLTEAEQKQMQKEQQIEAAEAQTGTTNVPRQMNPNQEEEGLNNLDPRFDRDDLRQGKPPPAVRKHKHLRIRRKRKEKGTPLSKEERTKAISSSKKTSTGDQQGQQATKEPEEAEMTDEEIEVTDDEDNGEPSTEETKKPGLVDKLFGKN